MRPSRTLRSLPLSLSLAALLVTLSHAQTTPEIDAGEAWLLAQQNADGSWGTGSTIEVFHQTSQAAEILEMLDPAGFDGGPSLDWIGRVGLGTVEGAARRGRLAALTGSDYSEMQGALLNARQAASITGSDLNFPEGGWGLAANDGTNNLDTALALDFFDLTPYSAGLLVGSQPLSTGTFLTYAFEIPANATSVQVLVTEAVGTFDFRFKPGSPPTGSEAFYRLSAAPVNLTGPSIAAGINYVRIDAVSGGTFGLQISYTTPEMSSAALVESAAYLLASQNLDGGWGLMKDHDSRVFFTARVLLALQAYNDALNADAAIIDGLNWLVTQQNIDGGFGDPASSVIETAWAYMALSWAGVSGIQAQNAEGFLLAAQDAAGHWNSHPLDTAVALAALRLSQREVDTDSDGVPDIEDNCPDDGNADQADKRSRPRRRCV